MSHPLEQRIAALRSRVRRLALVYGICWVASAGLAATLALGATDYLLRFQDRGMRVLASLVLVGVLGWTVYRYLYPAWAARLGELDLARRLQRRFPDLGDGLASAVEFLKQSEDDVTAGSAALRRAVISQTVAQTDKLDFHEAIHRRPVRRALVSALAVGAAAMVVVASDPSASRTALARLVRPLSDVRWPPVHHLVLRGPLRPIARGQPFEVEIVDAYPDVPLPSQVYIRYRFENPEGPASEEMERMRLLGKAMVARRENVTRPFSFQVEGGDDRWTHWERVEVVDPPAIESLAVKLIPPPYTGWPVERADRNFRALIGTRIEISAKATKPLSSALLCLEGGREIPGRLLGADGSFQVPGDGSSGFVVEKSGAYWFRLTDSEGIGGGETDRWEIRVVPDEAPSVTIDQPTADIFVTPQADVPIHATVRDDLAIQRIDLEFNRSSQPDTAEAKVPLFAGPARVQPRPRGLSAGDAGEKKILSHAWKLDALALRPGTQVSFWVSAADYRPQTAKSQPRRLSVITPEELAERIAARQAVILAELTRVLQMQRQSREQVTALEVRAEQPGGFGQLDVDHLRSAELNQRQVSHTLTSRSEGVPMHVLGLLADLDGNKVDSPDVRRRMQALLAEIDRLARDELPAVGRELTAAIKAAQGRLEKQPPPKKGEPQSPGQEEPALRAALAAAGKNQDLVIASLERMLDDLGRWDSFRRFHRDVGQLLREEEELARRTGELAQQTLAKDLRDLPPQDSADLKLAARKQLELAQRLEVVQQQMEQAVGQLRESDPLAAQALSDAAARARQLDTSGAMRSAGGQIDRNRMGQATAGQRQIVEQLREVLDILANRREHELTGLLRKLREADAELAEIARRQEDLRKRMDRAASEADAPTGRRALEKLAPEQQKLREETERMVRRLERLMVPQAVPPARQGAEKMGQAGESAARGEGRTAAGRAEEARKAIEDARRQLDANRRRAETELSTEQLARLQDALQGIHRRQEKALAETRRLDAAQKEQNALSPEREAALVELAREERLLEAEATGLLRELAGAEVFRLVVESAGSEMAVAAGLLDRRQTGPPTQQAEETALGRLARMLEALKPEPAEKEPDANQGGQPGQPGQQGPPGPQGQPGGIRDVAQLKLLKLMQEEVNRRTQAIERVLAGADKGSEPARRQLDQLTLEQGCLADLLLTLIRPEEPAEEDRGNVPESPPPNREESLEPPDRTREKPKEPSP